GRDGAVRRGADDLPAAHGGPLRPGRRRQPRRRRGGGRRDVRVPGRLERPLPVPAGAGRQAAADARRDEDGVHPGPRLPERRAPHGAQEAGHGRCVGVPRRQRRRPGARADRRAGAAVLRAEGPRRPRLRRGGLLPPAGPGPAPDPGPAQRPGRDGAARPPAGRGDRALNGSWRSSMESNRLQLPLMGERPAAPAPEPPPGATLQDRVVAALRTVYDPEIPVNIHELGLIYDLQVSPEGAVAIKMTLTSPACPVAGSLPGAVGQTLKALP